MAPPARIEVPLGGPDQFWMARFHKGESTVPTYLRVFWSWNASGPWQASSGPRLEFARYPALYKLYVVRRMETPDAPLEKDPAAELLAQLLPELQRALFPDLAVR
jgi:hypothetical protein